MSKIPGIKPKALAAAVAAVLGTHMYASAWSAGVDPASPAVTQAYVGSVTPEKVDAALAGLNNLIGQAAAIPGFNYLGGSYSVIISDGFFPCNCLVGPAIPLAFLQAASDADLGAPGVPVTLNDTTLQALASFVTPRNFSVGPGVGNIDTNGFDLTITGTVTTTGSLTKSGAGALILTGLNPWGVAPTVDGGTLKGSAASLQTSINNNARVEFNQVSDAAYVNVISGSGGVDKTGPGTLTFTNANSFIGGTNIFAGTLALQGAGTVGGGNLMVASGSLFDLSAANGDRAVGAIAGAGAIALGGNRLFSSTFTDTAFSGVISGSGGLTKAGTGTLTLSGVNTYTGSTAIGDGTLALAGSGNIAGSLSMSGGTFDISAANGNRQVGSLAGIGGSVSLGANNLTVGFDNSDTTFSGSISGTGGLTKTGTGTLTLDGSNSFTGITTISQGALAARTFSLSDTVVNNGTLTLFRNRASGAMPFIDTYSGNISGSGRLVKEGEDYVWLRGVNTYTGGTTVNAGILIGNTQSLQGNITNNAGLAFYQVADGTYAGRIDGTGVVFIYGPGTLAFAGSTLGGNVINGGHIARSGALGPLNIAGNIAFVPGSSFRVRVDAAGNSDRIVLSGGSARATLLGGTVDVQAAAGDYRPGTSYSILSAPGGVTGQFSAVTSNLAFLNPSLTYDPNNVTLTLTRNGATFQSVAQLPNQTAIGQIFTHLESGATGDMALVLNSLRSLSADDARRALDSVAAPGRAASAQVTGFTQRAVNQNVIGRLGQVESGGNLAPATGLAPGGVKLAFEEAARSDASPVYAHARGEFASGAGGFDSATKQGFWLRGFGGSGRVDGDADTAGYSYRLGGIVTGYDRALSDAVTLGVFGSYSQPKLDQGAMDSHTETKSYQAGLYGRYRADAVHVDGIVSYAHNSTDTSRAVSVGALNRTAAASFDGSTWAAQAEAGYTFKGRVDVTPIAGLQWLRQQQNEYTEQGAGALNLVVPGRSFDSLRSTLGVRTLYPFETAGATRMALEARAGWAHEFRDQGVLSARLAGDPTGASFGVTGISIPRDSAVAGVGLAAEAKRNLRVYAELSAELNGMQKTYGAAAGLRYQW